MKVNHIETINFIPALPFLYSQSLQPYSCFIQVFMPLLPRAFVKSTAVYDAQRVGTGKEQCPSISKWCYQLKKHGCCQELGQVIAIHKIPYHGNTERKRRIASCSGSVLLNFLMQLLWRALHSMMLREWGQEMSTAPQLVSGVTNWKNMAGARR